MNALWTRANTILLLLVLIGLLAVIGMLATRTAGGPLDPPGAPGSTQKTQISSIPFTIGSPGSYIVTKNLTATNGAMNGITIATGGVTLDLNGFELRGFAGGGGGDGISIPALQGDVVIKNGVIRFWSGDGIRAPHTVRSVFSDVIASQNGGAGIVAASGTTIRGVVTNENAGDGIVVLAEGTFYSGGGVFDSQASNNAISGISWNASRGRIEGNVTASNGGNGIYVAGSLNHLDRNTATANGGHGMDLDGVAHVATRNVLAENGLLAELDPDDGASLRYGSSGIADGAGQLTTHETWDNITFDD